MDYPRIASFKTAEVLRSYLQQIGADIPLDAEIRAADSSPLAQPLSISGRTVGNRWCIHPMEGWDGSPEGQASDLTSRRWRRFGESGAKLIWGGEAVAVRHDGRANPRQLRLGPDTAASIETLLATLTKAHIARFGGRQDLLIGLQLTHSGRFSRPNAQDQLEPRIAYHHPLLDSRVGIEPGDDAAVLTDTEIDDLIGDFVAAAHLAQEIGFDFVDLKHCHGYLGHELLSAVTRRGSYGGDLEGRTRFLRRLIEGVRRDCPGMLIGVRLSAFDSVPFRPGSNESNTGRLPGVPESFSAFLPYRYAFGCNPDDPLSPDLTEPRQLLLLMKEWGVDLVNLTAGSPYYNPHLQRPALFPPCDGYEPPEDPLVGVNRQIQAVRQLKSQVPDLPLVGSAYTYLQDYLPHAAQAVVEKGWVDFVGIGRMVLSYPNLPSDTLEGRLQNRSLCRTFSDCTTAPRHGMVSGCYPLDGFYRDRPERMRLRAIKRGS